MNYIVFDLEWNQCPFGKEREVEMLPFEIIEIGAVKLDENMNTVDHFQCLVQPVVYRKLHFRAREIIGLSMKELEKGTRFYKVIREFIKWCGDEYMFATWGTMDLMELQRNMRYYGLLKLLPGPVRFLDVQKLFARSLDEIRERRALEYAVDALGIPKEGKFHRALADAHYTAEVLKRVDEHTRTVYYSVDTFQNPKVREEELELFFETYNKSIYREFASKEEAMERKRVTACTCIYCQRPMKKRIRWFAVNPRHYYCVAQCPDHGLFKGKLRMKKGTSGGIYPVKTMKSITEEEALEIRDKIEGIRKKKKGSGR